MLTPLCSKTLKLEDILTSALRHGCSNNETEMQQMAGVTHDACSVLFVCQGIHINHEKPLLHDEAFPSTSWPFPL